MIYQRNCDISVGRLSVPPWHSVLWCVTSKCFFEIWNCCGKPSKIWFIYVNRRKQSNYKFSSCIFQKVYKPFVINWAKLRWPHLGKVRPRSEIIECALTLVPKTLLGVVFQTFIQYIWICAIQVQIFSPVFFKFGTKIPICNPLEKFIDRKNPIITLYTLSFSSLKSLVCGAPRRCF